MEILFHSFGTSDRDRYSDNFCFLVMFHSFLADLNDGKRESFVKGFLEKTVLHAKTRFLTSKNAKKSRESRI